MGMESIREIVEKCAVAPGGLITVLQDIQAKHGYLPKEALEQVAASTGRSLVSIYGVATFYNSFSLKPRGKHLVRVCLGTACHVRGAPAVVEEFERRLEISAGETTPDGEFTLETVNCLGACALGPIIVIDGHYFSNVTPLKVNKILKRARAGLDDQGAPGDPHVFPVSMSCRSCNHSLMDAIHSIDGHPSVRVTASFGHRHGWVRLSSLYGRFHAGAECEHEIPADAVVDFFCPHCHAELAGGSNCVRCGAGMIRLIVEGGGTAQVCSRRGCREQMLDLRAGIG